MRRLVVYGLTAVIVTAVIVVYPILCAAFGALAGIVVGWLFGETITAIFAQLGVRAEMWQLGAFLGFTGGFFRSFTSQSKN